MRNTEDIEAIAAQRFGSINRANAERSRIQAQQARAVLERLWLLQGPPKPEPPGLLRTLDAGLRELRLRMFWKLRCR